MTVPASLTKYLLLLVVMMLAHAGHATASDDANTQIEKAKELYAQALPMDLTAPKRADILKEAETILLDVIEKHPKSMDAHRKLMGVYLLGQHYSKAIRIMQGAITLSPEDPKLFLSLAFLYEHSGELEFANAMVEQALKLDADNQIAKEYKVVLQQKLEKRNSEPHQGKGTGEATQVPANHGQASPHGSFR